MTLLVGMINGTQDHIAIKDLEGRYLVINPAAVEWFGLPVETIVGRTNSELLGVAVATETAERDRALYETGQPLRYEETQTRDGVTRTWLTTKDAIRDQTGRVFAYSAISREITERVEAEAALARTGESLRQSVSLLQGIMDGTTDHIMVKGLDGRYQMVNRATAEWLGLPMADILGRTDVELLDTIEAAAIMAFDRSIIESGASASSEQLVGDAGGTRTWLTTKDVIRDAAGKTMALVAISREITALKRIEAQLRQSAKMEAVGQLAGGVAHDFNNMLTAIRGFTELVRANLPADDTADRADLDQVILAANRASELTRQLLAFSRKQVLAPLVVDPAEALATILPMVRRLLGEHIELVLQSRGDAGAVLVDPTQLEQVIVNLVINARDAMPDGGTLTIRTCAIEVTTAETDLASGMTAGPYLELAVSDTGVGIQPGVRDHIFEPFFTTKGPGKGTGLGLSMVDGIVRQSGGHVSVQSEPGVGSTFRIRLPRLIGTSPAEANMPSPGAEPARHGVILLVEDEPGVREIARRTLDQAGYTVIEAAGGDEATMIIADFGADIDLLLTDVVMPGAMGPDVARSLGQANDHAAMLYMSGYSDEVISHQGLLTPGISMVAKPFTSEGLLAAVQRALGAVRPSSPSAHEGGIGE